MVRINAKEHYRSFSGQPESVSVARDWVVGLLRETTADDETCWQAAVVTSELATNSVRHTASGQDGGRFEIWVFISNTFARIEVRDAGSDHSVPRVTTSRSESGHGLALVEQLARSSGTQRRAGYQATYAEVCWRDPTGGPRMDTAEESQPAVNRPWRRRFHDDTLPAQPTRLR
ncbi:ATP-binding protein [Lipingzhangella sp. LS1_29]|uniref:ATP-binding protein n=1 Tax=Lipingzhangella rawalii TaxID=2055835 RepID=A0ABU2H652_9ACTN|nr:ATP-binding protein [Lipingzhangella rawalii]MDS1270324.1 ATP-binding protein [Lipingzhangella rawalii]